MKTWQLMYAIIWIAVIQILFVLFSPFGYSVNVAVHGLIGITIFGLAFHVSSRVALTSCPSRIKRITKATRNLSLFQGVLGIALAIGNALSWGFWYTTTVSILHVANALAIVTQASSSATAYDMWEEREFQAVPIPT
jgi:uncharacterized membrane protein YciS (DUF1049 family)